MNSSTIQQKLSLEQLIFNIKNLNEQSDQSREQCFIANFANQSKNSMSSKPNQSIVALIKQTKGLQLGQICRKKAQSSWVNSNQIHEISQLKQTNKKLVQDNKALVRECVRLRIALKHKECADIKDYYPIPSIQLINMQYLNQINKLKTQNLQLRLIQFNPSHHLNQNKDIPILIKCIEEIKQNSEKLSSKIQQAIQKQKINKVSRSNTATSRTQDQNIRTAYQSQIKILKDQIQIQKEQIARLRRLSLQLQRNHLSPANAKLV